MSHRTLISRCALAIAATLAVAATGAPAEAAGQARTRLAAHVSPATVHDGGAFVVTGTVSPRGGTVELERLVGTRWHPFAHAKAASGHYAFSVKAPGKPALWDLRVVRAATPSAKAAASPSFHVRATSTVYVVTATAPAVTAAQPVVITGSVHPKATGSVQLQVDAAGNWVTVQTAKLTAASTFTFSTSRPLGTSLFRVIKTFSSRVAAGRSATIPATVTPVPQAPPTPPTPAPPAVTPPTVVTTTTLPVATTTRAYAATLAASGGTAPYTWVVTGLPAGLTATPAGVISGTPVLAPSVFAAATSSVVITAKDATGASGSATVALTVNRISGTAAAWGYNLDGELGDGNTTNRNSVAAIAGQTGVVGFAAGSENGWALHADGTVWGWGDNSQGQLGNSSTTASLVPVQVPGLTGVKAVAAGSLTVYALKSDGTVWAWGNGGSGELGRGANLSNVQVPTQIPGLSGITAIAAGEVTAYALTSTGTVLAWGYDSDGEIGNGTTSTQVNSPTAVSVLTNVIAIAAGDLQGYALESSGFVYAWGSNNEGELTYDTTAVPAAGSSTPVQVPSVAHAVALAAGGEDGYALTSSGTISSWGQSGAGELGDNSLAEPAALTAARSVLNAAGTAPLTGVQAVVGGKYTAYALMNDGTVQAWGSGSSDELGDQTASPTYSTVAKAIPGISNAVAIGAGNYSRTAYVAEFAG